MFRSFTDTPTRLALVLYATKVPAGFPSPAADHAEGTLDLNEHLVHRPAATYFVRAEGDSMRESGIFSGDLLVADRGLHAQSGDIVIAEIDGDLTVKRLMKSSERWTLAAANPAFKNIPLENTGCEIWGVVTSSIRQHCKR